MLSRYSSHEQMAKPFLFLTDSAPFDSWNLSVTTSPKLCSAQGVSETTLYCALNSALVNFQNCIVRSTVKRPCPCFLMFLPPSLMYHEEMCGLNRTLKTVIFHKIFGRKATCTLLLRMFLLQEGCLCRVLPCCIFLMDQQAQPDELFTSCGQGSLNVVNLLIKSGADINHLKLWTPPCFCWPQCQHTPVIVTPLYVAMYHGHVGIVRYSIAILLFALSVVCVVV